MAEAGSKPEDIAPWFARMPIIDHIGGILDANDKPLSERPDLYRPERFRFLDRRRQASGARFKDFIVSRRKNLMPVRAGSCSTRTDRNSWPGVQAIGGPAIPSGQTIFMISSAGKSFAFLGDLSHQSVLLLDVPAWISYTPTRSRRAEVRGKTAHHAGGQTRPLMSYHFAWPGYGLSPRCDGFRFFANDAD